MKPHDWKAGLKRALWPHSAFSLIGIGARFLPPPFSFAALGGFALWRAWEERKDFKQGKDTIAKASIDYASQVGSAAAGAFLHF